MLTHIIGLGSNILEENKVKSYLGFAIKSGKILFGYDNLFTYCKRHKNIVPFRDSLADSLRVSYSKKPNLVLISSTLIGKIRDKVIDFCRMEDVEYVDLDIELEKIIDKPCKVVSILDRNLSDAILKELKMD